MDEDSSHQSYMVSQLSGHLLKNKKTPSKGYCNWNALWLRTCKLQCTLVT